VDVVGQLVDGGTVTASFALDRVIDGPGGTNDFQHLVLPAAFRNLASVLFVGAGNPPTANGIFHDFAIDNVGTNLPPPVPEPETVILLASGVLAIFSSIR
jgi:hypothetical protein